MRADPIDVVLKFEQLINSRDPAAIAACSPPIRSWWIHWQVRCKAWRSYAQRGKGTSRWCQITRSPMTRFSVTVIWLPYSARRAEHFRRTAR